MWAARPDPKALAQRYGRDSKQVNQAEFFQQHAVDGVLSPQHMAQLLVSGLPEGETPSVKDGTDEPPVVEAEKTPAPAATPEPTPAPVPVVLAKDGVHTIPFEKLQEARDAAQTAKDEAARLAAEAEALRKQLAQVQAAPAPTPAPAPAVDASEEVDFGDYSEEALRKGVQTLVAKTVAPLQAELESLRGKLGEAEKAKEVDATTAHWSAIYGKHPDLDSIVESAELETWIKAQPSFAQAGIRQVIEQGSAPQVIELFDTFKASTGKTRPPASSASPAPSATAAAEAAAAIAAASKAKPPTSLSDIPAGSQAHVDPNAALLQATPQQLMARMATMSPAEIEALVARAL